MAVPLDEGWRKPGRSIQGGHCVEVTWRKSSYSYHEANCLEWAFRRSSRCQGGECAEVALRNGAVLVRDSKDPDGLVLVLTLRQWAAFTGSLGSPRAALRP